MILKCHTEFTHSTNNMHTHAHAVEADRNDFDNSIKTITFEPSVSPQQQTVTIDLVNDEINEAQEGFYLVISVTEISSADEPNLILERNGVALVRITDNDGKLTIVEAIIATCS